MPTAVYLFYSASFVSVRRRSTHFYLQNDNAAPLWRGGGRGGGHRTHWLWWRAEDASEKGNEGAG